VTPDEMEALIEAHLRAEGNGDPDGAAANYTEDIEHDVVGFPGAPLRGIPAALEFYRQLVKDIRTDAEERLHDLQHPPPARAAKPSKKKTPPS
jgi:ketosteroid isomerase-like protein